MKDVIWIADALDVLKNFPAQARHDLGVELMRVQAGLNPVRYRPMPSIGLGVQEIKVKYRGEYRLIYVARFEEGVYAISSFHKKSQRTPKRELELAKARYKQLVKDRNS
jgi:phage-related protein